MEIGKKIKEKRILLGLTQEELANRCELTKGYISQLENDKTDPSIETLKIILDALGFSFSSFFKDDENIQIKFSEEEQLDKDYGEYIQSWLVPSAQSLKMEPIYVILRKSGKTDIDYPHPGEEFGYVIKGIIKLHYNNREEIIKMGESYYFKTDKTHYIENIGEDEAHIIWVSCPPNF